MKRRATRERIFPRPVPATRLRPSRTSISVAGKSCGCTDFNASTFSRKRGSPTLAASAATSFSRTLPERYWSSVSHCLFCGLRKIIPFKSGKNSSTGWSSKPAMWSRSTRPFSFNETSNASFGCANGFDGLFVVDGSLAENRGFGCDARFIVVMLQATAASGKSGSPSKAF